MAEEGRNPKSPSAVSSKSNLDLPPEIIQLILAKLDLEDLKSVSLVSKPLLSLSSSLVYKLYFNKSVPAGRPFRRLVQRFPSIREIFLNCCRLDRALTSISTSQWNSIQGLNFRYFPKYPNQRTMLKMSASASLKSVKSLTLDRHRFFSDDDDEGLSDKVISFIQLFPSVCELDFGRNKLWDVGGFEKLMSKVPNLRKILLKGPASLNDHTLVVMAETCVYLEQVCFERCDLLTPGGVQAFLRKRGKQLTAIELPFFEKEATKASFMELAETISATGQNLNHLSIQGGIVFDDVLQVISRGHPPLKSLGVRYPADGYSMEGIGALLSAFQGLERLEIVFPRMHCDTKMSQLVKGLTCLRKIQIHSPFLDLKTLFSLIENCSLMESIEINKLGLLHLIDYHVPQQTNYSIKEIKLRPKPSEMLLTALKSCYPRLKGISMC